MRFGKASDTAGYTAAMRAIANAAPKKYRYLDDPYAIYFMPFPWSLTRSFFKIKLLRPFIHYFGTKTPDILVGFPGMSSLACLRHRYIDDQILSAYQAGTRQFIILGAGYDTRALRLNIPGSQILEVDHIKTQSREQKIQQKKSLRSFDAVQQDFISLDFSKPWQNTLLQHPLLKKDGHSKPMVIWEGVCCYLSEEEVLSTLKVVSKLLENGGHFIFDAFVAETINPVSENIILTKMRDFVAKKGEPFKWAMDIPELKACLAECGFDCVRTPAIDDIAEALSKQEGVRVNRDSVLKYLNLYCCER